MNLRILRKSTKKVQSDGKFYIDTLQYQHVHIETHISTEGIAGVQTQSRTLLDWTDVPVVVEDVQVQLEKE